MVMPMKLKVLIIDDSAFMRKALKNILKTNPRIEVFTARNGLDGIEKIEDLNPDVVTLDIEMPVMNGIETLKHIMKTHPLPVVMISSYTQEGVDITLECLHLGAVDFIGKPSGEISLDIEKKAKEIVNKVIAAASVKMNRLKKEKLKKDERKDKVIKRLKSGTIEVVAIGTSTGGPQTLIQIIPQLNNDIDVPIFIVQHMPPKFTRSLAERLNSMSKIRVKEADNNEEVEINTAYVAPGDWHMKLKKQILKEGYRIVLSKEPTDHLHRPSVDVLFYSVADTFKNRTLGILLTGMGRDGADGMRKIKQEGGITIAEDESTAIIFGMPAAAIQEGSADFVVPSYAIPEVIEKIIKKKRK